MEFSILNWNIQGRDFPRYRKPKKIINTLSKSDYDIMCIQEFPNMMLGLKKICRKKKYEALITDKFKRHTKNYNANVIFTMYPIVSNSEFNFAASQDEEYKKNEVHEECIYADINIKSTLIRIYNVHLSIGNIGIVERLDALNTILKHSLSFRGPTIVCGDMNTVMTKNFIARKIIQLFHKEPRKSLIVKGEYYEKDEKEIFMEKGKEFGFEEVIGLNATTWALPFTRLEIFGLKLDWMFVRGLKPINVKLGDYITDHRSVHVRLKTI